MSRPLNPTERGQLREMLRRTSIDSVVETVALIAEEAARECTVFSNPQDFYESYAARLLKVVAQQAQEFKPRDRKPRS